LGRQGKLRATDARAASIIFFFCHGRFMLVLLLVFAAFNARSAKGLTQKWFNPAAHGAASFVASGLENHGSFFARPKATAWVC
jgi:hypothetical protein